VLVVSLDVRGCGSQTAVHGAKNESQERKMSAHHHCEAEATRRTLVQPTASFYWKLTPL
jgi:hypothetical protein